MAAGPNGNPDLQALLRQSAQPQEQQVAVTIPGGPDGQRIVVPWQAGIVWELDQLRMLLYKFIAEGSDAS